MIIMNTEDLNIPVVVKKSLTDYKNIVEKLKSSNRNDLKKGGLRAILNLIPYFGGAAATTVEMIYSYTDLEFFRKFFMYIYNLSDISQEECNVFIQEIEDSAKDNAENVLSNIISRIDNINKADILANLTKAKLKEKISIEDFFRLSGMCERIPFTDFKYLLEFESPAYVDGGVTELLFSVGILRQQSISMEETNKYVLSINGKKLLQFGLNMETDVDTANKTEVNANWINLDNIDGGTY